MNPLTSAQTALAQTTLATVVSAIANTLRHEYSIEPEPVLRSVGIDPAVMQDPELRLKMTTLSPLWLRCVELSGDEAFGLRAARYLQPAQFYGIDLALCSSATFGEALQRHVQIVRVLTTTALSRLTTDEQGDIRLEVRREGSAQPTDAALDCFYRGVYIRLFERQTGLQARQLLQRLELTRQPPADPGPWQSLGVPVEFGCPCSALVFKSESWTLPLPGANPHLLAQLEQPILKHLAHLGLALPLTALHARLAELLTNAPNVEDLAQVREVGLIVAQRLARRVRQLCYRLAVGAGEFHHDVERFHLRRIPHVVGEVGADAKTQLRSVAKMPVQRQRLGEREAVGEHQPLGVGVDAQARY